MTTTETTHNPEVETPQDGVETTVPAAGQESTIAQTENLNPEPPKAEVEVEDEAKQLAMLNKILGTNYKTLDEARPKVEKSKDEVEAEKAEKKRRALEWAIASGKVSQEDIEKAAVLKSKAQRDIALDLFADEFAEANPSATRQDAEEAFKDFYQEHLEDGNSTKVIAQKRMQKLVEDYVKNNTKPVDDIETEYDSHVNHEQRFGNYNNVVKTIVKAQPKEMKIAVPYTAADGAELNLEYSIPIDDKTIESVRKEFLHENAYYALGAHENDVDPKVLQREINEAIELRVLRAGVQEAFKQHTQRVETDVMARVKNVPVTNTNQNFIKTTTPVTPSKQPIVHKYNQMASKGLL